VEEKRYLELLGMNATSCMANTVWLHLAERVAGAHGAHCRIWGGVLEYILARGTLARRLVQAAGEDGGRRALARTYEALCDALAAGEMFAP
jgi:hypothetical protein